ncbi:MAG: radical SAM protein [Planctomycetaceae bacterium]|nr:radical SAM protein [Planctomycetaceae bacterium]
MRLTDLPIIARAFGRMVGKVPGGHLWYLLRQMRFEKPHRFGDQVRFNSFFPPYPSQAFERFCNAVVGRRRVPFSTYIAVTGRCPFACEHCSYARREATDMPTDTLLDVVRQVKELGTCTIGFTGGEPLLHEGLEAAVATAGPQMASIVFTTGAGLHTDRARSLARAGVACVTVGIESADAATHDAARKSDGSFKQARAAVAAGNAAGLYMAVSTTALRDRIASGELERMYALAQAWGAREFRVLAPVATGGIAGCAAAMLGANELAYLKDFHRRCNRRRGGPVVASFAHLESAEMFGCGAGYHHLFIDAACNVCPCDLTPLSFGNIHEQPLADIWAQMGEYFPRPRCGCLMGKIGGAINAGASLPIPPQQSRQMIPPAADEPLPGGYRRLIRQ